MKRAYVCCSKRKPEVSRGWELAGNKDCELSSCEFPRLALCQAHWRRLKPQFPPQNLT